MSIFNDKTIFNKITQVIGGNRINRIIKSIIVILGCSTLTLVHTYIQ